MNSAEDDLEGTIWELLTAMICQKITQSEFVDAVLAAAFAYAAADSDALTAARRMVLHEATAPGPGHTSRSTATGGCQAHPRELDPSGSRAGRPEGATLSTGQSIPSQVRAGLPQPVDNPAVDNERGHADA